MFGENDTDYWAISIHALREEGDPQQTVRNEEKIISIHALREEGDMPGYNGIRYVAIFLSTPSARRATVLPEQTCGDEEISIHALREEGDRCSIRSRLG